MFEQEVKIFKNMITEVKSIVTMGDREGVVSWILERNKKNYKVYTHKKNYTSFSILITYSWTDFKQH